MNGGLSKLWTALTVVFAATLAAIVAQLFFLLWRRRKSKQFQNRIGPHEGSNNPPNDSHHRVDVDVDAGDAFKWQQRLYGVSSRVLFTIEEEEEREALDSETTTTYASSCADKEVKTTTVMLDVAVTVTVEVEEVTTPPFLTPCASPPYYTPSPSPSRDL